MDESHECVSHLENGFQFYLRDCVFIWGMKAVAFKTWCVCSVAYVHLKWWRKPCIYWWCVSWKRLNHANTCEVILSVKTPTIWTCQTFVFTFSGLKSSGVDTWSHQGWALGHTSKLPPCRQLDVETRTYMWWSNHSWNYAWKISTLAFHQPVFRFPCFHPTEW